MQVRALGCGALRCAAVGLLALVAVAAAMTSVLVSLRGADGPGAGESPAPLVATEWLSGNGVGDQAAIAVQPRRGPVAERATDGVRLEPLTVALPSAAAAVFVALGRSRRLADRAPVAGGSVWSAGPVRRRAPPAAPLAA
jgi:hypothetical protein